MKNLKEKKGKIMLIEKNRSIIPACDVQTDYELLELVLKTHEHPAVGAYKIGFSLALSYGLPHLIRDVKHITKKPIIYDHQKAGNDIPKMGENFAKVCADAGVDAVILFPFTGHMTQNVWQSACKHKGLHVIVGGEMTHPGFTDYISEEDSTAIYKMAADTGIRDFVVPGNKPDRIKFYRDLCLTRSNTQEEPIFYSPGLITQGGDISEAGEAAGDRWHAIVGRALYTADDPYKMLDILSNQL